MPTLEQLKEGEAKRHESNLFEIADDQAIRAYNEKLKEGEEKTKSFGDVLAMVKPHLERPQKRARQFMGIEQGKQLIWEIVTNKAQAEKREYIVNEHNKDILLKLTKYFIGDPSGELDLSKGLFFCGNVGTGKTFLMRAFKVFCELASEHLNGSIPPYKIISTVDIHKGLLSAKDPQFLSQFSTGDICFDDLGVEERDVKAFGNHIGIMETIIDARYTRFVLGRLYTHASANLTIDTIKEIYGDRVFDRMKQMFNFIGFRGESFRK